jgi:hypothetical protein
MSQSQTPVETTDPFATLTEASVDLLDKWVNEGPELSWKLWFGIMLGILLAAVLVPVVAFLVTA